MTHEKIERIIMTMMYNKIKYNKQFDVILERGFSDEAKESFFEEVVSDLETLLEKGVNSEFTKSMKDTVRALTDIAVKAGEEGRRAMPLEKLRAEKRSCLVATKMPKEPHLDFDLRYNVKQYLESTKTGMDVLKNPNITQTDSERNNMKNCRRLLDQIGEAVEKTVDVSSIAAAEKYNEIVAKLRSWRINLARSGGLYDAGSVGVLREILNAATAWEALCVSGGKQAKVSDVYEIPTDDLTRTVESEIMRQNIEIFLNRCEVYAQETAHLRNQGEMEKISQLRTRLRDIGAKEQQIVSDFRNGELSREDAEFELRRLRDDKEFLEYEIKRITPDQVDRAEITLRREMISKIERPIKTSYNHVKHNRLHIHALFEGMDFARLVGMINNNVSAAEFEAGIEEMQKTLVTRGVIDQQGQVLFDNIKKKLAAVDQLNSQRLDRVAPQKEEEEGSLLDQLLGANDNKSTESLFPNNQTKNTQEARNSIRFDDIL